MVPKNSRVVDIGSDHAYIPIYLVQQGIIRSAIASEITSGPRAISKSDIAENSLSNEIETRLGDGFAGINKDDHIDTAVIAGMGGQLIIKILSDAKDDILPTIDNLILEPNTDIPAVRTWLSENNYQIKNESIVEDGSHIYEVIYAVKAKQIIPLNKQQIMFGPILLKTKTATFVKKWSDQLRRSKFMYNNLQNAKGPEPEKIKYAKNRMNVIKEVLNVDNR